MTQESKASGYKRRQAYMRAAGYNVPDDGSWGPWQERIWKKLSTRQKEYSPHLDGLAQSVWDNITGNTTERFDPLDQGTIRTYDPENIDWSKTKRANSKVVDAVSGTWLPVAVGSAVGAAAPAAVKGLVAHPARTLIKAVPTFAAGLAGGKAVDKVSEAVTGKDFGTNVAEHTPLTPVMGGYA